MEGLSISNILSILGTIKEVGLFLIAIIGVLLAFMYKTKTTIVRSISMIIHALEEKFPEMSGPDKMDWLVKYITNLVPRLFRVVYNEHTLNQIAQNIYDDMYKFMDQRTVNKTGLEFKVLTEVIKTEPVAEALATDAVVEMVAELQQTKATSGEAS